MPKLTSRSVYLQSPSGRLIDRMFELACTGEVPWNWHDRRETPDGFRDSLHTDLATMFAIVDRRSDVEVGLVTAHQFRPLHRTAVMSTVLLPAYQGRVWPLEGAVMFADHLFRKFALRILYGRATTSQFEHIRSGEGRVFEVEAKLNGHVIVFGAIEDVYIISLTSEQWESRVVPLLTRIAT